MISFIYNNFKFDVQAITSGLSLNYNFICNNNVAKMYLNFKIPNLFYPVKLSY